MITRISLGICMVIKPLQVDILKTLYDFKWRSNKHHIYEYLESQLTEPFQEHDLIE